MKKIIAFAICMFAFCPLGFCEEKEQISTLNVDTSLTSDIMPDTAKIRFYVSNQGLNVQDLKEKNDKIAAKAIADIKAKLNQYEQIKTIAFRINNVYSYKDKVRIFQKYEVTNGFEVKLKDLSKISEIIQIATDAGVKRVDNVNFSIENSQKVCNDLLAKTAKNAKERANVVANSLDTQILKVKSVNPYCSLTSGYSQPVYFNAKAMDSASIEGESRPVIESIEPGTINVKTSINLVYYLK
ncbi:MAG: SIMPL domain-containing protein [Candidatus Gastranaerophilales bacterium]|nr:SIMPL domain-containing protein [Candidatus Gastranaerophilales bacterium]